jgi:hypothetical protein
MRFRKGFIAMGLAAALMMTVAAVPRADAGVRVFIRPGFGFYGPGPGFGWYGGAWGAPYGYVAVPAKGDVKIQAQIKGESIFVDGGYAGLTGKLKKFSLQPGNHQIEVRDASGKVLFQNTIRVIAGQTVDIDC